MPVVRRRPRVAIGLSLLGVLSLGAVAMGACGGEDQPDLSVFCQRLETAFGPEGALSSDYSDDRSGAVAVIDELEAIRRVAPLEIEPSLAVVNETSRLIIAAIDDPVNSELDAEKLRESETAAIELAEFSAEHCDLALYWDRPVVFVDPDRIPGEVQLDVRG